jgi:methionyl-tRNA formyltransferase
VTAHMVDAELDAGDIVLQRPVPVGPRETTTDLFHRTLAPFGPITVDGLALIAAGKTGWVPQDRSKAGFFPKRSEEDSRTDWTWPAMRPQSLIDADR